MEHPPSEIFDAHTHVWHSKTLLNRFKNGKPVERQGNCENLIELMDHFGVKKSLIITPTTLGFDNSLAIEISKEYKERLIPIVRIDLLSPRHLIALRRLHLSGAKGLRISINNDSEFLFLLDDKYSELWTYLSEENIPLLVHCAPHQFSLVATLADRWPKLNILIDHMGRVAPADGLNSKEFNDLLSLSAFPNISVKTSSTNFFSKSTHNHEDLNEFMIKLLENYSFSRLLWGSDWPVSEENGTYEDSFQPMLSLEISEKERVLEMIFADNFRRLFC